MKGKLTKGNLRGVPYAALISASLLLTGISGAIVAQEESASRLEEVVVTARKREESIQDVPVAVTAITPGQIERSSIKQSLDLAKLTPNTELHQTYIGGESLSASIRGIGFDDIEKSFESTVGVAIDGVFMATNAGGVFDMFDVQSVEVLRGPQGTLFGRNTIGGVINVTRTEPTGEWGGKVEAKAGDENMTEVKAVINMPLGDRGGVKLFAKDLQSESHVYNTTINDRRDFRDSQNFGLAIKYDFTDQMSMLVSYDDYDHNTIAPDNVNTSTNFPGALCAAAAVFCGSSSGFPSEADDYKTSPQLLPLISTLEGENTTLRLVYDTDNYQIKYIFGLTETNEYASEASWGTAAVMFPVARTQEYEQTSHEIQFISDYDGPLNFVAGIYSLDTEAHINSGPVIPFDSSHEVEARAVFGELTYDLSDVWSVTLGARYTEEEKELNSTAWPIGTGTADWLANNRDPSVLLIQGNPIFKDDNISYRAVIQRELEYGMMYASLSTGFRSGGFSIRATSEGELRPYQSEEVESMELGIRLQPTDNSQINITYFDTDYTDMQVNVVVGGADPTCGKGTNEGGITCTFFRNAGEVSFDGWEFEGLLMPTESLTIRAMFGILDGGFEKYDFDGVDIADRARVLYAPEHSGSISFELNTEIGGGTLITTAGMSFKGQIDGTQAPWHSWDPQLGPEVTIESYEALDISAMWLVDVGSGTMKIRVYGTDVLEEGNRISRRFDAGAWAWAELVPRRQFGASIGYEF